MILDNPEIAAILMEAYEYTEQDILVMKQMLYDKLNKLIINETFYYIENHDVPEKQGIEDLMKARKATRGQIETEVEITQYIAQIPGKYPELAKLIQEMILIIEQELFGPFIEGLNEKDAIRVLEIANKDLDRINDILAKIPQAK